jgi:hypothetical protein
MYLLTRELTNERIALCVAFFVTFSNFLIRMTFSEQSLIVFFFCFSGIYFGIRYLRTSSLNFLILSAFAFGLGTLTKYNAPFFIVSYVLLFLIGRRFRIASYTTPPSLKHILTFFTILFVCALPILCFNYFNYQNNGIVDVYVSRLLPVAKAQELFSGLAGQDKTFFDNLLTPGMYSNYSLVWKTDILLALFAFGGVVLWFMRKERELLLFFGLFLLIPFFLQTGGSALQKHFAFMHLLCAIPAGYALHALSRYGKAIMMGIVIFLTLFSLYNLGTAIGTPANYLQPSASSQLKEYIADNVHKDDLIVFDDRIYTSKLFWFGTPYHFTPLSQFNTFYSLNQQQGATPVQTNVYFIECLVDDCGWGWVKNEQNFNISMEKGFEPIRTGTSDPLAISASLPSTQEFSHPGERVPQYGIYRAILPIEQRAYPSLDKSHEFYFASYLYLNNENSLFTYHLSGLGALLNLLAQGVLYIELVLALLFLLIPFRYL